MDCMIFRATAVALLVLCAAGGAAAADDGDTCKDGEGDIAIAACTRVLDRDPKDADAYKSRAMEYLIKGEYDRAIADLGQAITLNPKMRLPTSSGATATGARATRTTAPSPTMTK